MDYDRLRELQQKFEENPRRYFAPLANEYRKGGQPKRAIEICRSQLAQMPGHMSGQIVYGQALYETGEFAEARTVFERALALDPENLIALRTLGDMSLQSGDTTEARRWYTRLLDADPKDTAVIALVSEIDASAECGQSEGQKPEGHEAACRNSAALANGWRRRREWGHRRGGGRITFEHGYSLSRAPKPGLRDASNDHRNLDMTR